jgi:hypothetical protein
MNFGGSAVGSLGVAYSASSTYREGSILTVKTALDLGAESSTFVSPDPTHPLSAATVEPPAPFSGSASFSLTSPTTDELTGDLAAELPGLGKVPLTRGLEAGLCKSGKCTKTLPAALRPIEGSGEFSGEFFGG